MTGRKTVTTTHGRYTVDGSMSEKTIKMMMAPYERLISIHDAETGEEITGRENAEEESGDAPSSSPTTSTLSPAGRRAPSRPCGWQNRAERCRWTTGYTRPL